jgi:hydroxymethylglutaryl-CoA lyase
MKQPLKLIECPRDAIQGIKHFIPTQKKIDYLNYLIALNVFDTIDFGSFVSHKAMPQMADSQQVVDKLVIGNSQTKLLAIVANERGAIEASKNSKISFLGFPFSISETFQLKNTNSTRFQSMETVKKMNEMCQNSNQELVVYLSMAFGNPYGDEWNAEIVVEWLEKLKELNISKISLADTTGMATSESLAEIGSKIFKNNTDLEFGLHLHTKPEEWKEKIEIATKIGYTRFDGAILGYGGCPMAQDELVGNMPMENLLQYFGVANEETIQEIKGKFLDLIDTKI